MSSRAVGVDIGTFFYQTAEKNKEGKILLQDIRNAFVELDASDEDIEQTLQQNNWRYIRDGSKYFVVGEDSMKVARMFPGKVELRRPMQTGVLNKGEEKKMLVLAKMIESTIGKSEDNTSLVCTCVSSESVDSDVDNTFHKARITGMFKILGWQVKVIDEGLAVILSERPVLKEVDGTESPFSGIAISFGSGKVNCVLAYKGLQILGLSSSRSGDYIDQKVSEQTDTPLAQVTSIKENKLDFENIDYDDDIIFALDAYYANVIQYTFKNFAKKFAEVKSQFETPLEIVIAGGTSMPNGFEKKVEEVVRDLELPFNIKSVRKSKDPRNSVVKGCLAQAIISQKKLEQNKEIEEIFNKED